MPQASPEPRHERPIPAREGLRAWLAVSLTAAAGLAVIWSGHLRGGGYVVALALAVAALVRATLPTRAVGALAVRGRVVDVVLWGGLAGAVAVGTWAVNIPPPGG